MFWHCCRGAGQSTSLGGGKYLIVPAKLCALVVEDNTYSRTLSAESLRQLGIGKIFEAADGTEGLQKLHAENVDFVLLDWYMPDINGAGFIRLVRGGQVDCAPDIPIIISTAYATRENITRIRDLGLSEILIKPFDASQLTSAIGSALSKASPTAHEATSDSDTEGQVLL